MTKSGANGALSYLLSHPEAKASELIPGAPELFSSVDVHKFITEHTSLTRRALNLRADYSTLEMTALTSFSLGVIWLAARRNSQPASPRTSHSTHACARTSIFPIPHFSHSTVASSRSSSTAAVGSASPLSRRLLSTLRTIGSYCLEKHTGCNPRLLALYRNLCRIRL